MVTECSYEHAAGGLELSSSSERPERRFVKGRKRTFNLGGHSGKPLKRFDDSTSTIKGQAGTWRIYSVVCTIRVKGGFGVCITARPAQTGALAVHILQGMCRHSYHCCHLREQSDSFWLRGVASESRMDLSFRGIYVFL